MAPHFVSWFALFMAALNPALFAAHASDFVIRGEDLGVGELWTINDVWLAGESFDLAYAYEFKAAEFEVHTILSLYLRGAPDIHLEEPHKIQESCGLYLITIKVKETDEERARIAMRQALSIVRSRLCS